MRDMAARVAAVIRVDAIWLAVDPLDMRAGFDTALGRVVKVFGAAHRMRRARAVENSLDKRRRMRQAKPAAGRRDQPDEGADGSRCFATFQGNSSSMRLAW